MRWQNALMFCYLYKFLIFIIVIVIVIVIVILLCIKTNIRDNNDRKVLAVTAILKLPSLFSV